jgi:hypothetical protein
MVNTLLRAGISGWHGGVSFPNAATTGPAAGGYTGLTPVALSALTEIETGHSGSWPGWVQTLGNGSQLVEGIAFTQSAPAGSLYIALSSGIAFAGCTFAMSGSILSNALGALSVQYCTFSSADQAPANHLHNAIGGTSTLAVDHCNIYWAAQAINCAPTTTVTNCYIHDPTYIAGDHTECILTSSGVRLTATGNTLLNSLNQTAIVTGEAANISYTVTGNLLGGGGYMFYSEPSASNIVVTGNRITTRFWPNGGYYGVFAEPPTWGSNGNSWVTNTWYDGPNAGQLISAPS